MFTVLFGSENSFINIRIHESKVFCTSCKGQIGGTRASEPVIYIRHYRLRRVDPRYIVSVCLNNSAFTDDTVPHQHSYFGATLERDYVAPILPLEFRNLRDGRMLTELCPRSQNFMPFPARLLIRLDIDSPRESSTEKTFENAEVDANTEKQSFSVETADETVLSEKECIMERQNIESETTQVHDRDWDDFIHNQPSTSGLTYSRILFILLQLFSQRCKQSNRIGLSIGRLLEYRANPIQYILVSSFTSKLDQLKGRVYHHVSPRVQISNQIDRNS